MTAFYVETLLLLLVAFALGLASGLWLSRSRRRRRAREVMVSVPAELPPSRARPGGSTAQEASAAPADTASTAVQTEELSATRSASEPTADAGATPPREPVADLFGHLLKVPPGMVAEVPPPPEPERPRRGAGAAVREVHPGVRPPVLARPEGGAADDLKLLKGIGPQNERRLHALGIFHFHQIAAWTPDEASWVGSYLAFPGRIEREDWIGQAKTLAAAGSSDGPEASRKPEGQD